MRLSTTANSNPNPNPPTINPTTPHAESKESFSEHQSFFERTLQPHHHHEAQQQEKPVLERRESQEDIEIAIPAQPQHHRRRSSTLQRLKEYMRNEEELDEAGKIYAKLM
ncbi:hypothetical protein ASPCAL14439 [Aspergillus calidoustus]|jgi:hypothetical protein|uniref:Uncharacterized protein n=1 Tax=Aspergillus calidoustus TaxID=454130 RepID=A0A0U5GK50_ASPCI|nr:hypothetical protein ASPCAL14439 [Aspergillus calidoustus]